ncbi:MAG: endonuclease domain-containing protein [Bacteroidales bacterium]|jgi:very-short-patch-repair endonuclease|nr:endonuclease domain-containing protein [Bacteroidales bacterium]
MEKSKENCLLDLSEENRLSEEKLKIVLEQLFPGEKFEHDKKVPNSECDKRPDYRCDNLKLIVEFDGWHHYTDENCIKVDKCKDDIYEKMEYRIVRIPYFVQMSSSTIEHLFGLKTDWKQTYPHGFILTKVLPSKFCELGIQRFQSDLKRFDYIKDDIIQSLKNRIIKEKGKIEKVLPSSLYGLIKE